MRPPPGESGMEKGWVPELIVTACVGFTSLPCLYFSALPNNVPFRSYRDNQRYKKSVENNSPLFKKFDFCILQQPEDDFPLTYIVKYRHKKKFERVSSTLCMRYWPQVSPC